MRSISRTGGRRRRFLPRTKGVLSIAVLSLVLLGSLLILPTRPVQGQQSLTITMGDIFFDRGSFPVAPGENVTIRLVNGGAIEHTFTLFAQVNAQVPVSDNAALQAYNNTNAKIVEVGLLGAQERQVQFTAPSVNGTYTYVCMVAGHSVSGMFGVMSVGPIPGGIFQIGIVQALIIIAILGTVAFAIIYQIRSTRP